MAEFVREYMRLGRNGTQAYFLTHPACKSAAAAAVGANRLLNRAKVREMIERLEEESTRLAEIDVARLLREAARLAFVDPRKLFHPDGRPKKPQELDDDTAAAVGGIEQVIEYKTVGKKKQRVVTYRYKVLDKNPSHERLFKHKGLFKADPTPPPVVPVDGEEPSEDVLDTARRIAFTLELAARGKAKVKVSAR